MRDNGPAYSRALCQHVPPSLLTAGAVVAGALPGLVQYNKYSNTHTETQRHPVVAHTHSFPTHLNFNDAHIFTAKHAHIWSSPSTIANT